MARIGIIDPINSELEQKATFARVHSSLPGRARRVYTVAGGILSMGVVRMHVEISSSALTKMEQILDYLYTRFDLEELMPDELIDTLLSLAIDLMSSEDDELSAARDRVIEVPAAERWACDSTTRRHSTNRRTTAAERHSELCSRLVFLFPQPRRSRIRRATGAQVFVLLIVLGADLDRRPATLTAGPVLQSDRSADEILPRTVAPFTSPPTGKVTAANPLFHVYPKFARNARGWGEFFSGH